MPEQKLQRDREDEADIPMAGMADVAFLLLVFFLVVTTIDVDTGIGMVLPPPLQEDQEPPPIKDRNMLKVLVNAQGELLVEEEPTPLNQLRAEVKRHVTNNGEDPDYAVSPQDAIVSIKTQEQTPYTNYVEVLDEVKMGYREVRNGVARSKFGQPFDQLNDQQKQQIKKQIPLKISIAEPDTG